MHNKTVGIQETKKPCGFTGNRKNLTFYLLTEKCVSDAESKINTDSKTNTNIYFKQLFIKSRPKCCQINKVRFWFLHLLTQKLKPQPRCRPWTWPFSKSPAQNHLSNVLNFCVSSVFRICWQKIILCSDCSWLKFEDQTTKVIESSTFIDVRVEEFAKFWKLLIWGASCVKISKLGAVNLSFWLA